ncbi:MAG: hypothetical protein AAF085_05500 [Planctomycetota bacterium]
MNRSKTSVIWLWLLACLCCLPAVAQNDGEDPAEQRWWVPYSGSMLMGEKSYTLTLSNGSVLELGDPRVGEWAKKNVKRVSRMGHNDLHAWVVAVGYYRIEEAEPVLMRAAEKLIKRDQKVNDLRHLIFGSLAVIAQERSVKKLKRMLNAPIKDVGLFGGHSIGHRPMLAAALFRLGDPAGEDYFLKTYRQQLLDKQNDKPVQETPGATIEALFDSRLVEQIDALKKDPKLVEPFVPRNIDSKLAFMRVNGMPLEELREVVRLGEKDPAKPLAQAACALAERGTVDDIKLLKALNDRADLSTGNARQAQRALVVIQCRLWKELAKK